MAGIDLQELRRRESERVEWKLNVADERDVVKTLVAFANDISNLGGGYVVCGAREVKDEHGFPRVEVVGLDASSLKQVANKVAALCRDNVVPPIIPTFHEVEASSPERRILVIRVVASAHAHTFAVRRDEPARYWVRVNWDTIHAQNGLLQELLVRKRSLEPFDKRPNPEATVNDLDLVALQDTLVRIRAWDPELGIEAYLDPSRPISPFVDPLCVREPLSGILRPRNFALLLFGRQPQRFFSHRYAIFDVYRAAHRGVDAAESQWLDGTLIRQAERLIELIGLHAPEIHDKVNLKHPHIESFPRRALKEAIVNAVVHRDYEVGQPIRVTVFEDRVEILSPGALPRGMDGDAFVAGKAPAIWRNQGLAWFFKSLELAQSAGQGIRTIRQQMELGGFPPPSFELGTEHVTCVIPAHPRYLELKAVGALGKSLEGPGEVLASASRDLREAVLGAEEQLREAGLFVEASVHLDADDARAWVDLVWRMTRGQWGLFVEHYELDDGSPAGEELIERVALVDCADSWGELAVSRLPELLVALSKAATEAAERRRKAAETLRGLLPGLRASRQRGGEE